ncbi:hypothetical protein N0V84_009091 [Fusarium piperis]|uniref:ATP-dependent DNA ligase family profile domain-containing protein n=1 Tax=Fusarium piperis TaxID=1435070 RepID=A0A9W8W6Y8_9HYPO|nr:hypothetical protein N0V84_009091 [Fusarium piperis]
MMVYYDILLLEDQSLINLRHSERFKILSGLITYRKGWSELVQRQVIDFGHNLGASSLRKAFAVTILARKEGLVLKPDEPYFDFADQRRKFSSCCIKLKKEYIGNFGDVGDFAVVGARYDPAKAMTYRIPGLKWTHFYIGCLDNREAVKQWDVKPEFTIVNVVELNETILREVVTYANPQPVAANENDQITLNLAPGVEQGSPLTNNNANAIAAKVDAKHDISMVSGFSAGHEILSLTNRSISCKIWTTSATWYTSFILCTSGTGFITDRRPNKEQAFLTLFHACAPT